MPRCKKCHQPFTIYPEDKRFYEKIGVPEPTHCPDCRQRRRFAWRNERALYLRKCDLCQKDFISPYKSGAAYLVYCPDCWWSDRWGTSQYAMQYDSAQNFFTQLENLMHCVPRLGVLVTRCYNSDFSNFVGDCKNCYLLNDAANSEDCYYGRRIFNCRNCVDNYNLYDCELAYESMNCNNCYNINFCEYCDSLTDCYFCYDCKNCSNCLGSFGLRHKQYVFFNEQLNKDQYETQIQQLKLGNYSVVRTIFDRARSHFRRYPHRYAWIFTSHNVTGDFIERSKNLSNIYYSKESEDSKYVFGCLQAKECYDCIPADKAELCYESMSLWEDYNIKFSSSSWHSRNITYSDLCMGSSDLFGCIGAKKKRYQILNLQYTKEEYERQVQKIIQDMKNHGEWGEFFLPKMSPFAYNETLGQEHLPLNKDEAAKQGFNWIDKDEGTKSQKALSFDQISEDISEVQPDIINNIFSCIGCNKSFKIIKQEFEFYKLKNLPLPRKCPSCRYKDRAKLRNPLKLWYRRCMNELSATGGSCLNNFYTPYSPSQPEKVYCEECYQKEIY